MLISMPAFSQPASQPQAAIQEDGRPAVDVELVIAVDVSYSVEPDDLAAQREGYAKAVVSEEFLRAFQGRPYWQDSIDLFRMVIHEGPENSRPLATDRSTGSG